MPDGTWVLQEYVMNPMTYQGNKFDLRVWTMVTSLDPLRLYLLGTGIPDHLDNYTERIRTFNDE